MSKKKVIRLIVVVSLSLVIVGCGKDKLTYSKHEDETHHEELVEHLHYLEEMSETEEEVAEEETEKETETEGGLIEVPSEVETESEVTETEIEKEQVNEVEPVLEDTVIVWDDTWQYAKNSKLHTSSVTLYRSKAQLRKNVVVAVNAGHGTIGGSSVKTLCHPDGSPKVTGGSTAAGATEASGVSSGTTFLDGTSEASANLRLAIIVKDTLLEDGYDVLMIREAEDVQLDNVARTVFANQVADCHIALHYDSSETDKGLFYIGVPDVASYKAMEPVASHWREHNALGEALLSGMREVGVKISGSGYMGIDLTQTSYSTIPSVDLEVGDRASDHSEASHRAIAQGIAKGLDAYGF